MDPVFFPTPADFRSWLEENHATATEVVVGLYKAHTGRAGLTWSTAVDQALCFGWIDGVSRRLDDDRWAIRFTPRRPGSNWSKVNLAKVAALTEAGLMRPAGIAAYEARREDRTGVYSFEQPRAAELAPDQLSRLRADAAAWEYWQAKPPWYRRAAAHWVLSAKRGETRERRLAALIEDSAAGRDVKPLRRPGT